MTHGTRLAYATRVKNCQILIFGFDLRISGAAATSIYNGSLTSGTFGEGGAFHFRFFVGQSCSQEHQHRLHCVDTSGHTQTHTQTRTDTHGLSPALSLSLSLAPSLCPPHLSSCCLSNLSEQLNLI